MISVRCRPSSWMKFSSLSLQSSMTRTNNWWSIVRISWRMASFKSFNVRGLWEISNTPKEKSHTLKDRDSEGPRHVSETENEVPGKHVSNNGHWLVCSVCCGTILLKPHIGTVYSSSVQFWPQNVCKMSGFLGSPCTYRRFRGPQNLWCPKRVTLFGLLNRGGGDSKHSQNISKQLPVDTASCI